MSDVIKVRCPENLKVSLLLYLHLKGKYLMHDFFPVKSQLASADVFNSQFDNMVNIAQQQVLCIFFFCACIIGIKLFKLHKLQKGVNSLDQLICVGKTKMYKLRISRLDLTLTTRSSLVSGYPPFCSESPQGTNTSITFSGHITIKILELEFRET